MVDTVVFQDEVDPAMTPRLPSVWIDRFAHHFFYDEPKVYLLSAPVGHFDPEN